MYIYCLRILDFHQPIPLFPTDVGSDNGTGGTNAVKALHANSVYIQCPDMSLSTLVYQLFSS